VPVRLHRSGWYDGVTAANVQVYWNLACGGARRTRAGERLQRTSAYAVCCKIRGVLKRQQVNQVSARAEAPGVDAFLLNVVGTHDIGDDLVENRDVVAGHPTSASAGCRLRD